MGEYAEMMLDGTCCEACGTFLDGAADGVPRYCSKACARDRGIACDEPKKTKTVDRGEKVRLEPTAAMHPQDEKPWLCECGKRFRRERDARAHWRDIHGRNRTKENAGAANQLRRWLHRIEEACARADTSPEMIEIRNAALAAIAGKPAPKGPGIGSDAHD